MKKVMGTNREVKSVTIFLYDSGLGKTKPKQAFRSTWNAFKKLLWKFFKNLAEFSAV